MGIPRILWSFWHDGCPPSVLRDCWEHNRCLHAPQGWSLRLCSDADLPDPHLRPDIHRLGAQHRADWMRLSLLRQYGGVWLDLGILCYEPIDWWVDVTDGSTHLHCPGGCFLGSTPFGDRFRLSHNVDVLENWALAAPPGSPFVEAWFEAFDGAVRQGLSEYCDELRRTGRVPVGMPGVVPAMPDMSLPYLTMHAVGAVVLAEQRQRGGEPFRVRSTLAIVGDPKPQKTDEKKTTGGWQAWVPPYDGPFRVHHEVNWFYPLIVWRLLTEPQALERCRMIKMRGLESRMVNTCYRLGWYPVGGSLARNLGWTHRLGMEDMREWLLWCLFLYIVFVTTCTLLQRHRRSHSLR